MLFSAMKAVENKWVSILKYFSGLCFFQKRVNNDFKKNFFLEISALLYWYRFLPYFLHIILFWIMHTTTY